MTSISDYRAKARQILQGRWNMVLVVTLVAALLGGLLTGSMGGSANLDTDVLQQLPDGVQRVLAIYLLVAGSIGTVLGLVQFIVGGTVQLGYCKYLLKLHDGEEGELKDLFSEFDRFGDGFILSLLTSIYIFLWTLLFIIPGIIAALKYAMAPFIMAENPGMKPSEAITASKEMMDGHKADLFTLDLSFIGWAILSALTLGIGSLWLNPYMNMSYAVFYRDLCPKRIVVEEPEMIPEEIPEETPEEIAEEITPEEE